MNVDRQFLEDMAKSISSHDEYECKLIYQTAIVEEKAQCKIAFLLNEQIVFMEWITRDELKEAEQEAIERITKSIFVHGIVNQYIRTETINNI